MIDSVRQRLLATGQLDGSTQGFHGPVLNTIHGIKHHNSWLVNNTSHVKNSGMDTPGQRIKKARQAKGWSQRELGEACGGWGASRVGAYETGQNEPGLDDYKIMAATLERSVGWLQALEPDESEAGKRYGGKKPALRDVPIVGFVIATPDTDGFFEDMGFPPGSGEAYVPWPTTDPNAYALRVRGDSMQPRIRPGEILIVEPSSQARPGDDVVVRTREGRKMVKQLLLRRGGVVTLGSINQAHQQTTILADDIETIHFVGAIVPRTAFVKEE